MNKKTVKSMVSIACFLLLCTTIIFNNLSFADECEKRSDSIIWNVQINITDGQTKAADFVILGEATDANDGIPADSYDAPKSPTPPSPYVYSYFNDGLPFPNDKLTSDFRHYCDGVSKQWDLFMSWDLSSYPSTIYLNWSHQYFFPSPYNTVYLRADDGSILTNMIVNNSYSFTVNSFGSTQFMITCENASCPIEGENCYHPYTVIVDEDIDYEQDHSTIGYENDYFETNMSDFDNGEDTLYSLSVPVNTTVNILLESATTGVAFGIFDDCPRTGQLLIQRNDSGRGNALLSNYTFFAGDYILMVDGNLSSFDYTISITSTANDPPIATNDTASVFEDGSVLINVSTNDMDPDGTLNLSSVTIKDSVDHGNIDVYTNATIRYTPNQDFFGSDQFNYTIKDDQGSESNQAVVNITIIDVNDPPSADFTIEPSDPSTFDPVYLNSTSTDVDGSIVNWTWDLDDGTMLFGKQVTHQFVDDGDYDVTLLIRDDDAATDLDMQTVSIGNQPPIVVDDTDNCSEDTSVWTDVVANDSDPDGMLDLSSLVVISNPSHGSTSVNTTTGYIEYVPVADFFGLDSYEYQIADDDGAVDSAVVSITVLDVNDAPVAYDDYSITDEDESVWIAVLANDSDIDGNLNTSSIDIKTDVSHGNTLINASTGEIKYTANIEYAGVDLFTYTVKDDDGAESNIAQVEITILAVNDPPTADFTIEPSDPSTFDFVYLNSTSTDVDGSIVNWSWDLDDGTILFGEQVVHQYTSDGIYDIELTVTDDQAAMNSITQMIIIGNQPPTAVDDMDSCEEDKSTWTDVISNDVDSDGSIDVSSLQVISNPSHGSTSVNTTTGYIEYVPVADFFGLDSYEYQIADDDGAVDSAMVSITVLDVNDAPMASFSKEPSDPSTFDPVYLNSTSTDVDGSIVNWSWDLGDGTMLYGEQISYAYSDDGLYSVVLLVTDDDGANDSIIQIITVSNQPPTAADDIDTCVEDSSTWTAVLSNDTDVDGIIDYSSLQVINSPSYGNTMVNVSTGEIKYTPVVNWSGIDSYIYQIADDDGDIDTAIVSISVTEINDAPVASFLVEPVIPIVDQLLYLNSTSFDSDGIIVNWTWTLGDGNMSYGEHITYTYTAIGSYNVVLQVTDDQGLIDQYQQTITVQSQNQAPMVVIEEPLEDDIISSDFIMIEGIASDPDGDDDLAYVEIRIDDLNWDYAIGKTSWSYYWDTTSFAEGVHQIDARSYDGNAYSSVDMVNVTILRNNPPYKPSDPDPLNRSTDVSVNVTLDWTGGDPDGDRVSYTLYLDEDFPPQLFKQNIEKSEYTLTDLDSDTTYYWKIKAKDVYGETSTSAIWEFTTKKGNRAPNQPVLVHPGNGMTDVSLPVNLQVRVSDPDGDKVDAYFYNAVDDALIGIDEHVNNNSIAEVIWSDRVPSETYSWYVIVSDSIMQNTSDTWFFTIQDPEIDLDVSIAGGFGVTVEIENKGAYAVEDLDWKISLRHAGLFRNPNKSESGTIDRLESGYYFSESITGFGIGRILITVDIWVKEDLVISESYDGVIFGFFLFLR